MVSVNIPGYEQPVNFPDSMSPEDIAEAIERDILPNIGTEQAGPSYWDEIKKGFLGGIDVSQATSYMGLAAILDQTGAEEWRDWAIKGARGNLSEMEAAAVPRLEDIPDDKSVLNSVNNFGLWFAYNAPQAAATTLAPLLGGTAGAVAGGLTPFPGGAAVGAVVGAFTPSYMMNAGEVYLDLLEQGKDKSEAALVAGIPMAMLDFIVPMRVGGRLVFRALKKSPVPIVPKTQRGFTKRVGQEVLINSLVEGGTEGLQEGIKEYVVAQETGKRFWSPETISNILNSAAAGAAGGALFGVGAGVLPDVTAAPVPSPGEEPEPEPAVAPIAGEEEVEVQPEVVPEVSIVNAAHLTEVLKTPEGRSAEELEDAANKLERFANKQVKQTPKSRSGNNRLGLVKATRERAADRVMGVEDPISAVQPEEVVPGVVQPEVEEAEPEFREVEGEVFEGRKARKMERLADLRVTAAGAIERFGQGDPSGFEEMLGAAEGDADLVVIREAAKAAGINPERIPALQGISEETARKALADIDPRVEEVVTPRVDVEPEIAPIKPEVLPEGRAKGVPSEMSFEDAQRVAAASEQGTKQYPGFMGSGKGGNIVQPDRNRALRVINDALDRASAQEKPYLEVLKGQILTGIRRGAKRSDKSGAEQVLEGRPELLGENLPWGAYDGEEKFWEFMEGQEVLGIPGNLEMLQKKDPDLRMSPGLKEFIGRMGKIKASGKLSEERMKELWNEAKNLVRMRSGRSIKDVGMVTQEELEADLVGREQTDAEIERKLRFAEAVGGLVTGGKAQVIPFWMEKFTGMLAPYVQTSTMHALVQINAEGKAVYGITLGYDNLIAYSMDTTNKVFQHTVPHEAWHWLQNYALTDEERQVLRDNAGVLEALADAEIQYVFGTDLESHLENYPEEGRQREVEATAASAYFRLKAFDRLVSEYSSPLQKVFDRVWELLSRIGEFFKEAGVSKDQMQKDVLAMMPSAVDDVLMKGLRGEMARRMNEQSLPLSEEVWEANIDAVAPMWRPKFDAAVFDRALKQSTILKKPKGAGMLEFPDRRDLTLRGEWVLFPRMISSRHPGFAPAYNVIRKQKILQNEWRSDDAVLFEPYGQLNKEQKQKVNALLELGRHEGIWFGVDPEGRIKVQNAFKPTQSRPVITQLSKFGDKFVFEGGLVDAYHAIRDHSRAALDRYLAVELEDSRFEEVGIKPYQTPSDINRMVKDLGEEATDEVKAVAKEAIEMIEAFDNAKQKGYVPFSRQGDHFVKVIELKTDAEGNLVVGKDGQPIELKEPAAVVFFETTPVSRGMRRTERVLSKNKTFEKLFGKIGKGNVQINDKVRRKMEEDLAPYMDKEHFVVTRPSEVTRNEMGRQAGVDIGALEQFAESFNSPEGDASVKEFIAKLDDARKGRHFGKHLLQTKMVPGYSVDFERSLVDYSHGLNSYLAYQKTRDELNRAIESISLKKEPRLRKYAEMYRDFVQSTKGEFAGTRQVGFFWYLAGQFSSAAVNLTQSLTHSWPYLSQMVGPVKAAGLMMKASKDVLGAFEFKGRFWKDGKLFPKGSTLLNVAKLPKDVRAILQVLADRGLIDPLITYETVGMTAGPEGVFKRRHGFWQNVLDVGAFMFANVEVFNRAVMAVAVARAVQSKDAQAKFHNAQTGNALWNEIWTHEEVPKSIMVDGKEVKLDREQVLMAEFSVEDTQFEMSRINRPRLHRGVGTAIFQFQGFPWQSLELMHRLATSHGAGDKVGRTFGFGKVAPGQMAFSLMMGTTLMLAGLWGLPFFDDLKEFYEGWERWIGGRHADLDGDFREFVADFSGSDHVAEMMFTGVGRTVFGLDMSRRFGFGDILPNPDLVDIGGVPAAMLIGNVNEAMERWNSHQGAMMSLSSVMPMFVKNLIKGWELRINRGVMTKRGDFLVKPGAEDIDTFDWIFQKLGFTPASVARRREVARRINSIDNVVDLLQQRYYAGISAAFARAYQASVEGDNEAAREYTQEAQDLMNEMWEHNREAEENGYNSALLLLHGPTLRQKIAEKITGITGPVRKSRVKRKARGEVFDLRGFVQP